MEVRIRKCDSEHVNYNIEVDILNTVPISNAIPTTDDSTCKVYEELFISFINDIQ